MIDLSVLLQVLVVEMGIVVALLGLVVVFAAVGLCLLLVGVKKADIVKFFRDRSKINYS